MSALAKIATDSEIRADKVERMASKIKMAEYMEKCFPKYQRITAFISGIEEGKIKVILPNGIYGKILYNPKEYSISKDGFCLKNNQTNEKLLVGDTIEVSFKRANTETGEIIFIKENNEEYNYEEKKGKTKTKRR